MEGFYFSPHVLLVGCFMSIKSLNKAVSPKRSSTCTSVFSEMALKRYSTPYYTANNLPSSVGTHIASLNKRAASVLIVPRSGINIVNGGHRIFNKGRNF
jgi:hypothetical protein